MSKRIVSILTASLLVLTVVLAAGTAFAQTADTAATTTVNGAATTDTSVTATPDVPNTGAGNSAMNNALLLVSGIIAALGVTYLSTRKAM